MGISLMKYMEITGIGNRGENLDYHISYISDKKKYFMVVDGYKSERDLIIKLSSEIMLSKVKNKKTNLTEIINKSNLPDACMSLALIEMEDENIEIEYAGDCRVYINGILVTDDHSLAWEKLIKRGKDKIETSELVCTHPKRNILTNSVKSNRGLTTVGTRKMTISKNDTEIILCTDGFWSKNHNKIIKKEKNFDNEYEDNYTAVLLSI